MKNHWFSRNSKFWPLAVLIAMTLVQFLLAQGSLYFFRVRSERTYERLTERMSEDSLPSNVREHMIYVQTESASNVETLANSLSFMQVFIQFNIFLVFWSFFLKKNGKSGGDE